METIFYAVALLGFGLYVEYRLSRIDARRCPDNSEVTRELERTRESFEEVRRRQLEIWAFLRVMMREKDE